MTTTHASAPFAQRYCSTALFLLGALSLIVPSGYSVGAVLLLLGGLYSFTQPKNFSLSTDRLVLFALIAFGLESLLNAYFHQATSSSEYDKALRFFFAIPAYFFIRWAQPCLSYVWAGIATGGVLTASFAIYQKFVLGIDRAEGYTHPIQFGNLSMLTALFCMAGLGWATQQGSKRHVWMLVLSIGAFGGLLGSLLSGSRGGWIGLPFVLLVLYKTYHEFISTRFKLAALAGLIFIGVTAFNTPQLGIKERVYSAVSDIQNYQADNSNTSLGARFEMWQGAFKLIQAKPLFGWGSDGYQPAMNQLVEQQKVDPVVNLFTHAHNELLDRTAKHGLVGLLILIALYVIPIWHFSPYLSHANISVRALAAAGTLVPVAYIDFGLSQTFFAHNSGVMSYSFWVIAWTALLRVQLLATAPNRPVAATER